MAKLPVRFWLDIWDLSSTALRNWRRSSDACGSAMRFCWSASKSFLPKTLEILECWPTCCLYGALALHVKSFHAVAVVVFLVLAVNWFASIVAVFSSWSARCRPVLSRWSPRCRLFLVASASYPVDVQESLLLFLSLHFKLLLQLLYLFVFATLISV